MPKVDRKQARFVIRLPDGRYYWEPDPARVWTRGHQYDGPDRTCITQRAAKKFGSISQADRFATAAGLSGYEVVHLD